MKREDWNLLAIATAQEPLSPVQLQKSLFLLGEACSRQVGKRFYKFVPYNYGPFDADIYRDAEALSEQGLVEIDYGGRSFRQFSITRAGLKSAKKIKKEAPDTAVDYLEKVVDWVQKLSFQALLRSIYTNFPRYKVNSVFQG